MSKITDFMRKIGLLRVSKGDATTGEFDSREDLNQPQDDQEEPQQVEQEAPEAPVEEQEAPESSEEPKQQM